MWLDLGNKAHRIRLELTKQDKLVEPINSKSIFQSIAPNNGGLLDRARDLLHKERRIMKIYTTIEDARNDKSMEEGWDSEQLTEIQFQALKEGKVILMGPSGNFPTILSLKTKEQ